MRNVSGAEYISLCWNVYNYMAENIHYDAVKPMTVSLGGTGRSLTIHTRKNVPAISGIFVHIHPGEYNYGNHQLGYDAGTLVLFDGEILVPGIVAMEDEFFGVFEFALRRLENWIEYARGLCCIGARLYSHSMNWNIPTKYCQFCGEQTRIEIANKIDVEESEQTGRFDRLMV